MMELFAKTVNRSLNIALPIIYCSYAITPDAIVFVSTKFPFKLLTKTAVIKQFFTGTPLYFNVFEQTTATAGKYRKALKKL